MIAGKLILLITQIILRHGNLLVGHQYLSSPFKNILGSMGNNTLETSIQTFNYGNVHLSSS